MSGLAGLALTTALGALGRDGVRQLGRGRRLAGDRRDGRHRLTCLRRGRDVLRLRDGLVPGAVLTVVLVALALVELAEPLGVLTVERPLGDAIAGEHEPPGELVVEDGGHRGVDLGDLDLVGAVERRAVACGDLESTGAPLLGRRVLDDGGLEPLDEDADVALARTDLVLLCECGTPGGSLLASRLGLPSLLLAELSLLGLGLPGLGDGGVEG